MTTFEDRVVTAAELMTVPRVGHVPTLEEAEAVAIDRLLARVGP